jgi:hypothetical protein
MICKFRTSFLVFDIVKICLNTATAMIVHVNGGGGSGGGCGLF